MRLIVAAETRGPDVCQSRILRERNVRIVTGDASDSAFDVAGTLLKAIAGMVDLEAILPALAGLDVDVNEVSLSSSPGRNE